VSGRLLSRVIRGYREIGSRIAFLAALVALSAALGAFIALPLWLFATSRPRAYSAAVLAAAAAAALGAGVRRILRDGVPWRRAAARALAVVLGIARVAVLLAGAYAAAAFAVRGLYLPAAIGGVVALAAAAWIGWGAAAATTRRPPETDR
jgi:hypothetical protein